MKRNYGKIVQQGVPKIRKAYIPKSPQDGQNDIEVNSPNCRIDADGNDPVQLVITEDGKDGIGQPTIIALPKAYNDWILGFGAPYGKDIHVCFNPPNNGWIWN